jgi:hypothetical protein
MKPYAHPSFRLLAFLKFFDDVSSSSKREGLSRPSSGALLWGSARRDIHQDSVDIERRGVYLLRNVLRLVTRFQRHLPHSVDQHHRPCPLHQVFQYSHTSGTPSTVTETERS